jgi:SAM-dependent methyltransferase
MYIPPKEIRCKVGPFDEVEFYIESTIEIFHSIKHDVNLQPNEHILDLACGCGRHSIPFMIYLNSKGSYDGLDACPELINWCNNNLQNDRCHFTLADVYTPEWNPDALIQAEDYKFPYTNNKFDLIIAESLFTHLLPAATINYFNECYRVLKPNGRLLFSTFVQINLDDSLVFDIMKFQYKYGDNCFIVDENYKQAAVCYTKKFMDDILVSLFHNTPKYKLGNWRSNIDKVHCGHDQIIIWKK